MTRTVMRIAVLQLDDYPKEQSCRKDAESVTLPPIDQNYCPQNNLEYWRFRNSVVSVEPKFVAPLKADLKGEEWMTKQADADFESIYSVCAPIVN
jgi:hypothetical protein